jgi:hypothetical protein
MISQEDFERLSKLMADKGVIHEGFELLADLRQSERKLNEDNERLQKELTSAKANYKWVLEQNEYNEKKLKDIKNIVRYK